MRTRSVSIRCGSPSTTSSTTLRCRIRFSSRPSLPSAPSGSKFAAYAEALTESGYAREEGKFAINRSTYVTDTDEQAHEIMPTVRNMHRGLVRMLSNEEIIEDGVMRYDPVDNEPGGQEIFDKCVFGSPATVRKKVREYETLGINHFSAYMNMGQAHEMVMGSLERFAREVMPAFR